MAQFVGSANGGLGFFHISIDDKESNKWLNMKNCGIIAVMHGDISEKDLVARMTETWDNNWPWQLR